MQKLFTDFKPNTAAEWKAQLIKDLRGEAYESLVWQNENGFGIKPLYTSEDLAQDYLPAFSHADWEIAVAARPGDEKTINAQLLRQLSAGAASVWLHCSGLDLVRALEGVQLNHIQSVFFLDAPSVPVLKQYLGAHYDLAELRCTLLPERLDSAEALRQWAEAVEVFRGHKTIRTSGVDVLPFHHQGCLPYYEVALVMSQLTEYLEYYSQQPSGWPGTEFVVRTGVSADYFVQMTKLRAIRRLWNLLRQEYGVTSPLYLLVETSLCNKSISDNYNNLLRTTVEAMAAVAGGCNELLVTPFDELFPVRPVLSERLAVNQQLILKEESYLNRIADVACGSYYLEHLTDEIARKALETFKGFEAEGGYFQALKKGLFSAEIAAQAARTEERIRSGEQVVIGVNRFRNEAEKIDLGTFRETAMKEAGIHNPVLNFELEHYFKPKDA
jgi:methylmalonyl-CoA mutase